MLRSVIPVKGSILNKYQKNYQNIENWESKSIACASKGKTVTRLKKKENIKKKFLKFLMRTFTALPMAILLMILKKKNTKLHHTAATNLEDNKRHADEMLNQNNVRNIAQTELNSTLKRKKIECIMETLKH